MMLAACPINRNNGLGSQTLNTVSVVTNRAIAATQLGGVSGPPASVALGDHPAFQHLQPFSWFSLLVSIESKLSRMR